MTDKKHGITVREKSTNKIVDFIECETGRSALRVLSGIRINMNHNDFKASEEYVSPEDIEGL